jgi:2-succinyl-6-hydroxy-2,4-cyclohexadiene-1-carboxylate synthase
MNLYCLHGFLGRPADWEQMQLLPSQHIDLNYIDLFNHPSLPLAPFSSWSENFNNYVSNKDPQKKGSILIGYSMGGRLALHALLENPKLYRGAIFISTHLGLKCPNEKQRRIESDALWARAFMSEPWESVLSKWNSQGVFLSDDPVPRYEEEYSKTTLANALQSWSLGLQGDLREGLSQINLPILWAVGGLDKPYLEMANQLVLRNSLSKVWVAEQCGHRLPWQNKAEFRKLSTSFIQSITDRETENAN